MKAWGSLGTRMRLVMIRKGYCKITLLLNLTHYNIYPTGLLITDGVRIYTDLLMNSF